MDQLLESFGESGVLASAGFMCGLVFGFAAQRSRFCLRAAVLEFWHRQPADRLPVWLLAFSSAVLGVQGLMWLGHLNIGNARQMAATGSLSGAVIGGLAFGIGMVLTRGCASRLLILSANGNLRALLSGLVFAVVAQASLSGVLASSRVAIASWWTVEGGAARDLLALTSLGSGHAFIFGLLWASTALFFGVRAQINRWQWVGGVAVGLMVTVAWWFTYFVSKHSFEVVAVQGITFSGPSADWLMRFLTNPDGGIGFDTGLLPGVFLGALLGALIGGDWKIEGFNGGYSMTRYILGAVMMGFGAMLAGGCAVGSGMSGGAVFSLTAWVALAAMWVGAGLSDRWLDRFPVQSATSSTAPPAP
jgi:uncharacterized membrane protein YedE/YeeE